MIKVIGHEQFKKTCHISLGRDTMKKIYHLFWLFPVIALACYKIRTMDVSNGLSAVLGKNIVRTVALDEVMNEYARWSKTLEEHVQLKIIESIGLIDPPRVKIFLNRQIQEAGLDPNNFKYYVGSKWLVFPLKNNTYGFIIPGGTGLDSGLNITKLGWRLGRPDLSLAEYRLQIIKTLIEARFDGVLLATESSKLGPESYTTNIALDKAMGTAIWILSDYLANFSVWLGRVVIGSSMLYSQAASAQRAGFLQMEIDQYVLKSNDIELIRARIADLKEQLEAEKRGPISSKLSFINRYLPTSLQWGELGYTAKALNLLEKYLVDNRLELELYKEIMDKQRGRLM